MTLIADSGSTKTAWCLIGDGHHTFHTQGINPFQQTEDEICDILKKELLPQLSSVVRCLVSVVHCPSSISTEPAAPKRNLPSLPMRSSKSSVPMPPSMSKATCLALHEACASTSQASSAS